MSLLEKLMAKRKEANAKVMASVAVLDQPPVAQKYPVPSLPGSPPPPVPRPPAPAPAPLATPRQPATTSDDSQHLSPGSTYLISTTILTACVPACLNCLSCWYVEKAYSDGTADLTCYCCKKPVTGDAYPDAASERRAAKEAKRQAEDAAIEVKG